MPRNKCLNTNCLLKVRKTCKFGKVKKSELGQGYFKDVTGKIKTHKDCDRYAFNDERRK